MRTPNLLPWVAVALGAHGAAFAASEGRVPSAPLPAPPLEIELGPPPRPEAPLPAAPEPPPEERPSESVPVARPVTRAAPRATAFAPATPAKVGALLTSGDTSDTADPVAFFSDPNGGVYGSGVVARGGQAEHGTGPMLAESRPPSLSRGAPGDLMPAANLSRAPALDDPDACRGFFPVEAAVDAAKVDLVVVVQADGRVTRVTIAREAPQGEGFGSAARACLLSKRFTPAADRDGRAVAASSAVRVHFTR